MNSLKKILLLNFVFLFYSLSSYGVDDNQLYIYEVKEVDPITKLSGFELPANIVCGYKDKYGQIIITAKYAECSYFNYNQATVKIYGYDLYENNEFINLYCINTKGDIINTGACKGFSGLFYKDVDALKNMQLFR